MINKNGYVKNKLGVQYQTNSNAAHPINKHSYEYCLIFTVVSITATHGIIKQIWHNQGNNFGLDLLIRQSQNLHLAIVIWTLLLLATLLQFACFLIWAKWRFWYKSNPLRRKRWDNIWITVYLSYIVYVTCATSVCCIYLDLKAVPSVAVLSEMSRLLMKGHAFIRSNIEGEINLHSLEDRKLYSFSHYVYFLFAPTLVYKDTYRRTETIRWLYVCRCACEFIVLIVAISCVYEKVYLEPLKIVVNTPYNLVDLILFVLENCMAAVFILVATFCCVLHIWQSAFAEMLRFDERSFFAEWWYSKSFREFHRTWNHIVQHWLYQYVYKDVYDYVVPNNRTAAKFSVFFISCFFHEIIIGCSFRLFLPMFFVEFFLSGMVVTLELKNPFLGNLLFLLLLSLSVSSMLTGYTLQFLEKDAHNDIIGLWRLLIKPI